MAANSANVLPAPALAKWSRSVHGMKLCDKFLGGYCPAGENCKCSHAIFLTQFGAAKNDDFGDLSPGSDDRRILALKKALQAKSAVPPTTGPVDCDQNVLDLDREYPQLPKSVDEARQDRDLQVYKVEGRKARHDNDHANFRHILILPTMSEILSPRRDFLPKKSTRKTSKSDVYTRQSSLFRLKRRDEVQSINDCIYDALKTLVRQPTAAPVSFSVHTTAAENRYGYYTNVVVHGFASGFAEGACLVISLPCPPTMRYERFRQTGILQDTTMVALVAEYRDKTLSVTFFEVHYGSSDETDRADMTLKFAPGQYLEDVRRFAYMLSGISSPIKLSLVKFRPKIILASFYHTLEALQQQKPESVAFRSILEESDDLLGENNQISPKFDPIETSSIDLSALASLDRDTGPIAPISFTNFPNRSTMDVGVLAQAKAMFDAFAGEKTVFDEGQLATLWSVLTQNLTLVQGGPGTGKTFLAKKICRVLADSLSINRLQPMGVDSSRGDKSARPHLSPGSQGPMLVVTAKNECLDNLCEDLDREGFSRFVRVGEGCKRSWKDQYSLREVREKFNAAKRQTNVVDQLMKDKNIASTRVGCKFLRPCT